MISFQNTFPDWKDTKAILGLLRQCNYNTEECINVFQSINDDGMYVCMCIYVCAYVYMCVYSPLMMMVCMCVCAYMCVHMCTCVYIVH